MEMTMSRDYRYLMGKISMDFAFAEKFFTAKKNIIAKYNLTQNEINKLFSLSKERFEGYKKAINLKMCDCDSCCNGGEGKGNCSECFSSCCQ